MRIQRSFSAGRRGGSTLEALGKTLFFSLSEASGSGMLRAYEQLREQTKAESRFVIGPWVHTLESRGDLEYPNSHVLSLLMIKEATAWFNHQLKGLPYPYRKGGVEAYIIGEETTNCSATCARL